MEAFIKAQTVENYNLPFPPIRIVVVGDDREINEFVSRYVHLMDIDPKVLQHTKVKQSEKSRQQADGLDESSDRNQAGFTIDRQNLDIRIYLIPQQTNTLAHYLAMHDDLYCHNIYNFFTSNSLLKMQVEVNRNITAEAPLEGGFAQQLNELATAPEFQGAQSTYNVQRSMFP